MRRFSFYLPLIIGLSYAHPVSAYGTVRILGQDVEHERITRRAYACGESWSAPLCMQSLTLDMMAGKRNLFGAVGHPDETNYLRGISAAHCDNGDYLDLPANNYPRAKETAKQAIVNCRDWMQLHFNTAVLMAGKMISQGALIADEVALSDKCIGLDFEDASAKCKFLTEFGFVIHATQDFYSHSNYTDIEDKNTVKNPPGMDINMPAAWLKMPIGANPFPEKLLTGCYEFFIESAPWSCRKQIKHSYVNKDKGRIDLGPGDTVVIDDPVIGKIGEGKTPRGKINNNFARSVRVATLDSRDKLENVQTALTLALGAEDGLLVMCAILKDNPMTDC